jgi:hypothetical protein
MNKLFNITEVAVILDSLPKRYRVDAWMKNFAANQYPDFHKFYKF